MICTKNHKNKLIRISENGRTLLFKNPEAKEYSVTRVDGCLINDEKKKCDFLVSEKDSASVFVEFKGRNVEEACAQLKETINHKNVRDIIETKIACIVMCSKFPKFDTYVIKAKEHFAKKYKAHLHVFTGNREIEMAKIVR